MRSTLGRKRRFASFPPSGKVEIDKELNPKLARLAYEEQPLYSDQSPRISKDSRSEASFNFRLGKASLAAANVRNKFAASVDQTDVQIVESAATSESKP